MGLGFLLKERYLLFLIVILLLFAIISLAYGGWKRRRYAPFLLGLTAAIMVVAGKFVYEFSTLVYGDAALLLTASVWNGWPRKTTAFGKGACSACASREQASRVDQPEANPSEGGSS